MKIISFGDVHEDTNNLIKIKSELENADLIVISGDLTNYHGKIEAKKVLDSVKKYNKHLLAQYGNLDQPEVDGYLTKEGTCEWLYQSKRCKVEDHGLSHAPKGYGDRCHSKWYARRESNRQGLYHKI
ncbi:MAG: metallophosphoesterase family protein [Planctomycetes bacterium]|nr:metallophosphoesterase family protein [Planctomycetota bacterium]